MLNTDYRLDEYIQLLCHMIRTPSFSGEEESVAALIREFFTCRGIPFKHKGNNTWAVNKHREEGKPVVLLNSHIDTVRPAGNWTKDPFTALLEGDKLTGLGSNDAGASLVTLLAVFVNMYHAANLPYNLIFAASAEEETSGPGGMQSLTNELGRIDLAVVGEPTMMKMAVAEKGLMVLDCTAHGQAGHAARDEGDNALYKAIDDIQILRRLRFEKISETLGQVKITVTQIEAGYQHNVIPNRCNFTVDVRTNEHYSNEEAFNIIKKEISSAVKARSFRLNASGIEADHPIVKRAAETGLPLFGSPTTSDQAVMPFPSVKIGPGDSARSHTADEFVLLGEIESAFDIYIKLLDNLKL